MSRRKEGDEAVFADLATLEVNADQLADLFQVKKGTVLHYAREAGMPRVARGRYRLIDCVQWYQDRLRQLIQGEGDLSEERKKLIIAQRERHQIDAAQKRGELIDAEEIATVLNELGVIFSTQLDGLGARAAPALLNQSDVGEIRRILLDETRTVRRSTSATIQTFAGAYAGIENNRAAAKPKRRRMGGRKPNTPS